MILVAEDDEGHAGLIRKNLARAGIVNEVLAKNSCSPSARSSTSSVRPCVKREDVVANCDYVGDGYGIPTQSMNDAVLLLARLEGLLFDPVYSGKALAGLIDLVKTGYFEEAKNIVFLHTGGSAALFAYKSQLKMD